MVKILSALIAGTVIGVAVAKVTSNDVPATPEPASSSLQPATIALEQAEYMTGDPDEALDPRYVRMLDAIAAVLDQEVAERRRLEEKLDSLTRQVQGEDGAFEASGSRRASINPGARRQPGPLLSRLVDAGLDEQQAREVKARVDQIALAQLELRFQAEREQWDRDTMRQAMRDLGEQRANLRTELGEVTYDKYLYASGTPNRVSIVDVMTDSAAAQAGLKPGDMILSYGGESLFNQRDLRSASRGGVDGETVPVNVQRGNQRIQVYLPRGPLGVQLGSEIVNPGQ